MLCTGFSQGVVLCRRQAGQMVFWSLIIAAAASCVVSILVACPFLMTFSTFGLLLLLLLGSCLSLAFLAVVVVGNDGCVLLHFVGFHMLFDK